tara:strand:+ start:1268 stop:2386 length:1119 start_codon:yes stop_codon:yes gene_type:complete
MDPKIRNKKEDNGELLFTLEGVDVCFANGLRRTIISDIPIVVFKTKPYSENRCTIFKNTTKINNDIVKQRLSSIPICISDKSEYFEHIDDLLLELDVENTSDVLEMVTTENFKIKNIKTNKYLDESSVKEIFPPFVPLNNNNQYYIDFLRLEPKISNEIPGESIKLTCKFCIGTSKEDGMFNVTGTCSYGYTIDHNRMNDELNKLKETWKNDKLTKEEIDLKEKNWKLLDGKRVTIPNSFDFIINSVGIYENDEILKKACRILSKRLENIDPHKDGVEIKQRNTNEKEYDIILHNEDYTTVSIIKYMIYNLHFIGTKKISFCGTSKSHDYNKFMCIRICFSDNDGNDNVIRQMMEESIKKSIGIISKILSQF